MIVNIHNYETYFLLYIDNELSAPEKAAVELFIQQNPSFQNELALLQNAKLDINENVIGENTEEKIIFEDKLSLYQISESDTACLLYLEHEMLASEVAQFEEKLAKDPTLQISLANWEKTMISPDDYQQTQNAKDKNETLDPIFKNSLYKKEAKVISIKAKSLGEWNAPYRIASVAALLMLWWGYQWLHTSSIMNKNGANPNVFVAKPVEKNSSTLPNSIAKNNAPANNNSQAFLNNSSIISKSSSISSVDKSYTSTLTAQNVLANNDNSIPEKIIENQSVTFGNNINELSRELKNELKNDLKNDLRNEFTTSNESINSATFESSTRANFKSETTEVLKMIPVSYKEVDMNQEEEERTLYIGNLELDGAKFREVSRKLTAIFKRNKSEKEK